MPTRRLSRLTTGNLRTLMSAMFCATSSSSASSKQYLTSRLMISRMGVFKDIPSATARTAMSRSVIMPMSRPSSPTGRHPQSSSAIRRAAARIDCPGLAILTLLLIASRTRMALSFSCDPFAASAVRLLQLRLLLEGGNDLDETRNTTACERLATIHQGLVIGDPGVRFGQLLACRAHSDDLRDDELVDRPEHRSDIRPSHRRVQRVPLPKRCGHQPASRS